MPNTMIDRIEAWCLRVILFGFGLLPPRYASLIGGAIARMIGPFLPSSHTVITNLKRAFPHMSPQRQKDIMRACWANLGSTFAELPHLAALPTMPKQGPGWHVLNEHILHEARESGRPIIFFSGHLGNWELMPLILARYGLTFSPFYRAPNNPFVDRLLCKLRQHIIGCNIPAFPKGKRGARDAVRHMAKGGHLGVLGDQKMNDGVEISFFGHPTMAAPAAAALALRFDALIITGRVMREGPARFTLDVTSCLDMKKFFNVALPRHEMIRLLTQNLNNTLEKWITQRPEEWLWQHRRWAKTLYHVKKM